MTSPPMATCSITSPVSWARKTHQERITAKDARRSFQVLHGVKVCYCLLVSFSAVSPDHMQQNVTHVSLTLPSQNTILSSTVLIVSPPDLTVFFSLIRVRSQHRLFCFSLYTEEKNFFFFKVETAYYCKAQNVTCKQVCYLGSSSVARQAGSGQREH